jgi:hypothetical protein
MTIMRPPQHGSALPVLGALLDRLHILELNGESYRLKQSKARRLREGRSAGPDTGKNISAS